MSMRHLLPFALAPLLFVAPLGCACSGQRNISAQSATTVRGTVTYREKIALKDVEMTVTLRDLAAPADAKPLSTRTFRPESGPPYSFSLDYLLGDIRREHEYGVTAELKADGRVAFRSAEPVKVLTQGHGSEVEVVIRAVPNVK